MSRPTAARVRQVVAFLVLAVLAGRSLQLTWSAGRWWRLEGTWPWVAHFLRDPTNYFFLLSLAGVGLRLFWGRYLAICFMVNLLVLGLVRGHPLLEPVPLAVAAVVLLLAGRRMHVHFEGRATGRLNRWAAAHPTVYRLRWLVLLQSTMLALVFCAAAFGPEPWSRFGLGGVIAVALLGMVFQKTWALLLLLVVAVLELALVVRFGVDLVEFLPCGSWGDLAGFSLLLALAVGSLVLALPMARVALRRLRQG
jgi:hypothetical protein